MRMKENHMLNGQLKPAVCINMTLKRIDRGSIRTQYVHR